MMSDKALFVHNHYLRGLPVIPSQRCQHLALSILVSTMTSKPPTAVMSNPHLVKHQYGLGYSKEQTEDCQYWMDHVIGGAILPDTTATVVGSSLLS